MGVPVGHGRGNWLWNSIERGNAVAHRHGDWSGSRSRIHHRLSGDQQSVTPRHAASLLKQSIGLISLVVRDYDEALAFFVGKLGFVLVEDSAVPAQGKRWVVVAPPGASGPGLLLARASTPEQEARVGLQTGGRVFLFLYTDNFWRDFERYKASGIEFVREPKRESYGTVAVFKDLYGNLWDLLEPSPPDAASPRGS